MWYGIVAYLIWGWAETYWEYVDDTLKAEWFTWQWWALGILFLPILRVGGWVLRLKDWLEGK